MLPAVAAAGLAVCSSGTTGVAASPAEQIPFTGKAAYLVAPVSVDVERVQQLRIVMPGCEESHCPKKYSKASRTSQGTVAVYN